MRTNAQVKGRWHDNRHTLITDLAESGAGDQTIMDIAGHVSKQMLKHYSHIRMEAKRRALESIVNGRPAKAESDQESTRAKGYPHGLPSRSKRVARKRAAEKNDSTYAPNKTEEQCSVIPANTRRFEGGTHKSPHNREFQGVVRESGRFVSL